MSQTGVPSTVEERRQADARSRAQAERQEPRQLDALHTETGDTTIADTVVV
ncbi:MAG: Asp23/Gls24 family envelope stress response protein, partial [Propionibacteriaceae bacterium]